MLASNSYFIRSWLPALCLGAALSVLLVAGCDSMTGADVLSEHQVSPSHSEATNYEAILLANRYGHANAINDAGIVAGFIEDAAVRWKVSSAGITGPEELGTLSGRYADASQYALAVNGSGVIVGYARSRSHGNEGAFVYTDELRMQLLPRFLGDTYNWRAVAVNDKDIIAGWIDFAVRDDDGTIIDRRFQGAVWLNLAHEPMLLPPLEDHNASRADAIGMNGLVTGHSRPDRDSQSGEVGVAWRINDEGQLVEGPYPLDPGFHPGSWAASWTWPVSGNSPNDASDIVGWQYSATSHSDAALLRGGRVLLLGSLLPDALSYATGINDPTAAGVVQIVGQSGWDTSVATLWTVDADDNVSAVDLGAPRQSINASALGINTHGWIAGRSASRSLSRRPTLWLPVADDGEPPPAGDGPTASFEYSCGNSPTCEFTDTSTEGVAAIDSRDWVTGSQTKSGSLVSFTFEAGDHVVTLTVTDAAEATDQTGKTVKCSNHPRHGLRCS
jgi:hypothetical protein